MLSKEQEELEEKQIKVYTSLIRYGYNEAIEEIESYILYLCEEGSFYKSAILDKLHEMKKK